MTVVVESIVPYDTAEFGLGGGREGVVPMFGGGMYCSRFLAGADHSLSGITPFKKRPLRWRQLALQYRPCPHPASIESLGNRQRKRLVLSDRAAECSAELVLVKRAACRRKIVTGIEIRVTKKFERVAMKCIGTRFCNDVDLSSAVPSVFRIEVAGKDAKFGDGVEVRNDRRSRIHVFLGVASVHREGIRELPLSVDRNRPGFSPPEGESALTPTSCCVFDVRDVAGTTPGWSARRSV